MKKFIMFIFAAVIVSLTNYSAKAQENADYYAGKWDILTEGTPSGDAHSLLILTRGEDGKLTGTFKSEGKEPSKLTRVEEKDDNVTCYFVASGYDVYLYMEKVEADKMEGSMMDMFDAYATRVKENK
ncbi:Rab5-interacting family protein [Labilibaculum manganireducens]|uniref:Lipocalin-like domain-containing protein n=1 Tax=Labilibaculum manganireducens TaxID=1940525 RepID=A0A2N3I6S0_9BACT|nr:Rab5-interacting family protein [Labilibaculum manganireducens]PKQ65995.1 hypothetical protein BZG01_12585 [Labilibaculum manganireducens]